MLTWSLVYSQTISLCLLAGALRRKILIFGLLPVAKINFIFPFCTSKACINAKKKNQTKIFFQKTECIVLCFDLFYSMEISQIHGSLCERLADSLFASVFLFFNINFLCSQQVPFLIIFHFRGALVLTVRFCSVKYNTTT